MYFFKKNSENIFRNLLLSMGLNKTTTIMEGQKETEKHKPHKLPLSMASNKNTIIMEGPKGV